MWKETRAGVRVRPGPTGAEVECLLLLGLGLRVRAVLGFSGLSNRALEGFHQRFSSVCNGS